jgi:hypothetical protein
VPFLALTEPAWLGPRRRVAVILLVAGSLVLGQIVYPLNYSEYLAGFNGEYSRNRMFWLNLAKNLLWLAAMGIATTALFRRSGEERAGS